MTHKRYTLAERPDLRDQIPPIEQKVWPRFMLETPVAAKYWGTLFTTFAEYQTVFVDDADRVIANGVTIPIVWDGRLETLPEGWDAVLMQGVKDHEAGNQPNAMSALAAIIEPEYQGKGLSAEIISAMRDIAKARGFHSLIAPVRPTLKPLHPLIPIEHYAYWTREDGLPFDPWMRVHARLGAEVIAMSPRSMHIPGSVAEWEEWTGLTFPASGQYVVQGACQPIEIDREAHRGVYYDPNVWMRHRV